MPLVRKTMPLANLPLVAAHERFVKQKDHFAYVLVDDIA